MQEPDGVQNAMFSGQGNVYEQFANEKNNVFNNYLQNSGIEQNSEDDADDIYKAAPIPMHVTRSRRKIPKPDVNIETNNNDSNINIDNNVLNNKDKGDLNGGNINESDEKQPVTEETKNVNIPINNVPEKQVAPNITPYMPVAQMPIVRDDVAEKRKSDDTWKTILLVVFSILLIGAVVLGILYALGVFKKQDNDLAAKTDTDKANIQDDDVTINDDNNNLPSGDDGIDTNSNVDGQYDTGILQNSSINTTNWDGIGKSDGLLTNGDINYTNRFQEIVNCENSPNVTYTLWRDLNGDGVCQVNEIVAKGKGFMVDGNCVIINGRKFPLTDDIQAYSNLNKLSNQELKVLNHTSTYWKDGKPHIILDDLKTSVNIDSNNISGILNIEGYKIGDFSTSDISKNSFASDVVNSYLNNNNNLTDAQKKLISAWSNGRSSANVKQIMDSYEMNNSEANSNLTDTHKEKDKNI